MKNEMKKKIDTREYIRDNSYSFSRELCGNIRVGMEYYRKEDECICESVVIITDENGNEKRTYAYFVVDSVTMFPICNICGSMKHSIFESEQYIYEF